MTTSTDRLRLRKSELFAQLGYAPHPAQILVHRSRALRRVVACGTRFGKSTIGVYECVAGLLQPRDKTLAWLVGPTYDLTNRIFRRVVESFSEHMPHRVLGLDARERSITIANLGGGKSVLRAKSADNPTSLLGEALDFAVIDECAQLKSDMWNNYLSPRLIDRKGWSLMLSTPHGGGWFHDEYMRGARRRPDPDYQVWSMPTSMNPFISPELIEAERQRLPEEVFAAQYMGAFLNVPFEVCEKCGGPKVNARHFLVMFDGKEPDRCSECGELVNEDGTTAVAIDHTGERATTVIIHCEPSPDPATVPSPFEGCDLPEYVHAVVLHGSTENPEELPPGID